MKGKMLKYVFYLPLHTHLAKRFDMPPTRRKIRKEKHKNPNGHISKILPISASDEEYVMSNGGVKHYIPREYFTRNAH